MLLCAGWQREVAGRIDDQFCGWSLNVGVAGRYPLAAESSAVLNAVTGHVPTSLGVAVYQNFTTLLVGTAAGQLLKVSAAKPKFHSPLYRLPRDARDRESFGEVGVMEFGLYSARLSYVRSLFCSTLSAFCRRR